MTSEQPRTKLLAALICDDARREHNGKEILIGIYTGDILVAHFPANLRLCLWIYFETDQRGEVPLEVRAVVAPDDRLLFSGGLVYEIDPAQLPGMRPVTLPLPAMPVKLDSEAVVRFQWKLNEASDWETIVEKHVLLGAPPSKMSITKAS